MNNLAKTIAQNIWQAHAEAAIDRANRAQPSTVTARFADYDASTGTYTVVTGDREIATQNITNSGLAAGDRVSVSTGQVNWMKSMPR